MSSSLYTFQIVIERRPGDDGYIAYTSTLPGCFTRADTVEGARQQIRLAICEQVESLLARGEPIRQNGNLVHLEELTIVIPESTCQS